MNRTMLPRAVERIVWVAAIGLALSPSARPQTPTPAFSSSNPFYAPSTLPFHAPPFNRIKDSDYQPAIDAGIAEDMRQIDAIANDPTPPTFANTIVALRRPGSF